MGCVRIGLPVRLIVAAATLAGWAAPRTAAQQIDGVVVPRAGIWAFSGPGKHFYPAYALVKGESVIVHGIAVGEPGQEFLQIVPADDKRGFSWVRVEDTRTRNDGVVVAARDKVPVYVGSDLFGTRRYVRQVRLSAGDVIVPKGKTTDVTGAWYSIIPPDDEVRYVLRDELYEKPKSVDKPAENAVASSEGNRAGADRGIGVRRGASAARAATEDEDEDTEPEPQRPVSRPATLPGNGASSRTTRSAQPVARSADVATQLDEFDAEIAKLRETEPDRWNIPALRDRQFQLERVLGDRPNAVAGQRLARAQADLEVFIHYDEVLRRAKDGHRQYLAEDERDAAEMERLRQRVAVPVAARPLAIGTLQAVRTPIDGQPAYALVDGSGKTIYYVVGAKGLGLDRYLRPVGLFGKVRQVRGLTVPVIDTEQISPNVRLEPAGR